jgi:hypothetical protein
MGRNVWVVACFCAFFFMAGCEAATEEAPAGADVPVEVVDEADGDAHGPDAIGDCEIDDDCIGADLELGTCAKPVCDLVARVCIAGYADDGDLCEDGDACTVDDTCTAGKCVAGGPAQCDDENECTHDTCDVLSGCANTPNQLDCEDDNPCTDGDVCAGGVCTSGPAADCDDLNTCTSNFCDPSLGCQAVPLPGAACEDGDACSSGETCSDAGVCEGGEAVDCDDGEICTDDSCDEELGCIHEDNVEPCDDEDACTEKDFCQSGTCVGGDPPDCDDENVCTTDGCDEDDGCTNENNEDPCDDELFCTGGDVCQDGSCGGDPVLCDDGDVCTTDACDEAGDECVTVLAGGTPCNDDNPCTVIDECKADGSCTGLAVECNDQNTCTADFCDPENDASPCQHVPEEDKDCDDGNACTVNTLCNGETGQCEGTDALPCDDGNPCTFDACDGTSEGDPCTHDAIEDFPCNDANACTDGEACQADASCGGGEDVTPTCDDGLPCTFDYCDATNADEPCQHDTADLVDSFCDDGNGCTTGETCQVDGTCGAGVDISDTCDDENPCTDDSCDPDAQGNPCQHQNNTSVCSDGSQCTLGDGCAAGVCVSGDNVCECQVDAHCGEDTNLCNGTVICDVDGLYGPKNKCIDDPTTVLNCDTSQDTVCTTTQCETYFDEALGESVAGCLKKFNDGDLCNDGDECTTSDACNAAGLCAGSEKQCSDGNPCTDDLCNPTLDGGCYFPANDNPCEDGLFCTANDACDNKQCKPGPAFDCDDAEFCTTDVCSLEADSCIHLPKTNTPCDDGDVCTEGTACSDEGQCVGGTPPDCVDNNECTLDTCDSDVPGGCAFPADVGKACSDGDACTYDDVCNPNKVCGGTDKVCDDLNSCTSNACDPASVADPCVHDPTVGVLCDDGNACTDGDACNAALTCAGTGVNCDDDNPCTLDSCDTTPGVGCLNDDEDPADCTYCEVDGECSAVEICSGNQCVPFVPAAWNCPDEYYAAGDDCDCTCGTYDPDCDDATATVVGCAPYSKCLADGACEALPPTCLEYCDKVTNECAGANSQYTDHAACMAYCEDAAALAEGTEGDSNGNTISCRITYAELAAVDTATNCANAGASGGNTCGGWCENFCALESKNCTDNDDVFITEIGCLAACAGMSATGSPGDESGDTVQCRLHQLGTPAYLDVAACAYGALDGGGQCVAADWVAPTCSAYCADAVANCTGDYELYDDETNCEDFCGNYAGWSPGSLGDLDGNSLYCRMEHASAAATDQEAHCAAASQSGSDTCGTWCDNYCHYVQSYCTGANVLYDGLSECHATCQDFAADGADGDAVGDTVQCRMYYANLASILPGQGCPGAGPDGGGSCVNPEDVIPNCNTYCAAMTSACTGDDAQYDSENACMSYCFMSAGWDAGNLAQTDVNTIGCRQHHADLAAEGNAPVHCAHASASGGNQCGSWCTNYCDLSMANCTGANALYADEGACLTACADFDATGAAGDGAGDTVQCRVTYAGKAGGWGNVAGINCPSAAVDGGGVCVDEVTAPLLLNEMDYDQEGEDTAEFIEFVNTSQGPLDLSNYTIELVSGADSSVYETFDLSVLAGDLGPGDYLVIGSASVVAGLNASVLSISADDNFIQNGSNGGDAIQVVKDGDVIDSASYEAIIAEITEGSGHAGTDLGPGSLSRCPNGTDTDDNAADFQVTPNVTPGQDNDCACGDTVCGPGEDCESCGDDCGACEDGDNCVEWEAVESIIGDANHGCTTCHSAASQNGGLDLSSMVTAKAGGNHGPAVVECDPMASYFYLKPSWDDWPPEVVQFGQKMPLGTLGSTPLSDTELAEIYNWIDYGAQEFCVPDYCAEP